MVNLDLKLGKVNHNNDGLVGGLPYDIKSAANDTFSAISKILSPIDVLAENTINVLRHPIDNVVNPMNNNGSYRKMLKFIPASLALAVTQALDKPFATVEKAMEYVVSNNLERMSESLKSITTGFLSNIITSNGETNSSILRGIGATVKGTGDFATSVIKAPFWLVEKSIKAPRHLTKPISDWSEKWMAEQKLSPENYLETKINNTNAAANDEFFNPEEKAA